jgi:hypothetical protein
MIQISITQAAFDAIAETLPFGSTMYEAKTSADGGDSSGWSVAHLIASTVCQPGECYSDVIIRLRRL